MSWKIGLTWYAKWFYQQLHAIMFNVVCLYFQKGEVAYFKYLFPVLQVFYCKCVSCLFKHFTVCSNWQQAKVVVHRSHVKKTSQCCINMSKIEYEKNVWSFWNLIYSYCMNVPSDRTCTNPSTCSFSIDMVSPNVSSSVFVALQGVSCCGLALVSP